MRRIPLLVLALFTACASDSPSTDDPSVRVQAPPGVFAPGDVVPLHAITANMSAPTFAWTVAGAPLVDTADTVALTVDAAISEATRIDVSVRATDADGVEATATTTIEVDPAAPSNQLPVAYDDAYSVGMNGTLTASTSVLANDLGGGTLQAELGATPTNGTVSFNADGTFTYVPNPNFSGSDTFTYRVSVDTHASNFATVTITVNPGNQAPTALADTLTFDQNGGLQVSTASVLANDTDDGFDGSTLTATLGSTSPAHGVVVLAPDGIVTYTPTASYEGPDSFSYTASDGTLSSAETTVTIVVDAIAPVVVGEWIYVPNDGQTHALDVLANDINHRSGTTLSLVRFVWPREGATINTVTQMIDFKPPGRGSHYMNYIITDGHKESSEQSGQLLQAIVSTPPQANDDTFRMLQGATSITIPGPGVLYNDTNPDNLARHAHLVTQPSVGSVTMNEDGSFMYTGAGGTSFTYHVTEMWDRHASNTATVTIGTGNRAPANNVDRYFRLTNTNHDITRGNGIALPQDNDTDPDGDQLRVVPFDKDCEGGFAHVTLRADGSMRFRALDGFDVAVCRYTITDGSAFVEGNIAFSMYAQ